MSAHYDDFAARRVFGSLDGLRALSITGVVWHHAARSQDLFFAEAGAHGVPLFFAISGFLITTLLLRERERTGDISLKDFYARRSLRIFPLYYAVLLIYVAAVWVKERGSPDGTEFFSNLKFFATYTSNWFVELDGRVIFYFSWSLATEEQFYLVWPSMERFLGARARHAPAALALAVVGIWALVAFEVVPIEQTSLGRTILLSVPPAICMGVALAHVLHEPRGFAAAARVLAWPGAPAVLLGAVVGVLLLGWYSLVAHALMVLLVGACVVREEHVLARLLRAGPLASVGRVSYGIYMLHMLALNVAERILGELGIDSRLLVAPLCFAFAWGAALVSFRYFEGRFLRLKGRFTR